MGHLPSETDLQTLNSTFPIRSAALRVPKVINL
jgi:hypothetical protein